MIRAWFKTSPQLRLMHSKSPTMHRSYIMRGWLYILSFGLSKKPPPDLAAERGVSDMHLAVCYFLFLERPFPWRISLHTRHMYAFPSRKIHILVTASQTCAFPASSTCLMAVKRCAASKCEKQYEEAQRGGWISNYFHCSGSRSAESH